MIPGARNGRWPIAVLTVVAFLFAPGRTEERSGLGREAGKPVEARVLAPTFREAIAAVRPKLTTPQLQAVNQRLRQEPMPLTATSAALAMTLAALFIGGFAAGSGSRPTAGRAQIPRGPPSLSTTY